MSAPVHYLVGEAERKARVADEALEKRIKTLEKWAHKPFDFSELIARIERLEKK